MLLACWLFLPINALAQDDPGGEIEQLRQELQQLRQDYEQRLADLEQRLEAAEQQASRAEAEAVAAQAPPPAPTSSSTISKDFNPAIGVIFQGQAWSHSQDPADYSIPGFPLGGEAGPEADGLSLGETEIDMNANIDDWFTGWLTVPIKVEDGEVNVELEEAWIETLSLPAGLAVRMGRMFSNIGYLNQQHSHAWDFVDLPLPYQAFLGGQYIDDGLELRWVAPLDIYLEFSAEALRGDRYPAAGARNSGFGAWTLHALAGGDVGLNNYWQAGLSWLSADSADRPAGNPDEPLLFTGNSDLGIAEFVWKWAPNGNWRERNFKFQAEYLWRKEDGRYALPGGPALPWNVDQQGWYAQAVYQPFPHWRFGARYDALSGDRPGAAYADTPLGVFGSDPRRYSLMADYSHSEFSRLRLQYTDDQAVSGDDRQWALQYIFSMGAHGAHTF